MAANLTRHTDAFSSARHISPADLQKIAALGDKTLINNRRDSEVGAGQPTSAQLEAAAKDAGLRYAHLPVIRGQITEPQARKFVELLATSPKPVLAFCRSGARSQNLFRMANAKGWVDVNQPMLQHVHYPNVVSLGGACSLPNAQTAAAARKQIVVVAESQLALRSSRELPTCYDDYGSCPLTVEKGKIMLAEFEFGGKPLPGSPLDPTVPRKSAWTLKKNVLPAIYRKAMLKDREWLARPVGN